MSTQQKTPGVYINEITAFPNSVVEVATAVPAFVGYTERAQRGASDLTGIPTRISSMVEFEVVFGGPPKMLYNVSFDKDTAAISLTVEASTRFLLHQSMRFFFNNGGGPCWIVSVGGYGDTPSPTLKQASDFTGALAALEQETEPTILVAPDAMLLDGVDSWATVANEFVAHCIDLQNRVSILDVFNGDQARTYDAATDIISGTEQGFRTKFNADKPSYGIAYYPWVRTTIVDPGEVDFGNINESSRGDLQKVIEAELAGALNPDLPDDQMTKAKERQKALTGALTAKPVGTATQADIQAEITSAHNALMAASSTYKEVMSQLLSAINVLPPSGGIAGVYARVDNEFGVFKAPANTSMINVVAPTVEVSHDDQEDLNVPIEGKAINAIRTFAGRGVLIWGARTLDGNSQDWRYVSVRRTLLMLEQSIKMAAEAFVFAANDASTWLMVRNMIDNFLNNQWKAGALAGATPADAYDVSVGLGSTMTGDDILNGYMRVSVRVAVTRPAEFIVITFQQKMQTS